MSGTQRDGLPVEVKRFDTIGTHDFSDNTTWSDSTSSLWVLIPDDGEAIRLTEVMTNFSEDLHIHEGGEVLVEFWIDPIPAPVVVVSYASIADWFSRAFEKYHIPYSGPDSSANIIQLNIPFSQAPVLWSSGGVNMETGIPAVDAQGQPKLTKMTVRIADDVPYTTIDGGVVALARSKYVAEIYVDPDYVAPE